MLIACRLKTLLSNNGKNHLYQFYIDEYCECGDLTKYYSIDKLHFMLDSTFRNMRNDTIDAMYILVRLDTVLYDPPPHLSGIYEK